MWAILIQRNCGHDSELTLVVTRSPNRFATAQNEFVIDAARLSAVNDAEEVFDELPH
jgi:hypothetical protein